MLRFGGVATGAVASSVAEGVAQAFKASVQKGQELRRGQGWHFCSYPRRISLYIYLSEYPLKYLGIDFQITNSFLSIDWCVHGGYLHCSSGF